MPSPTTTELPIPKSWDEFEDICADMLRQVWKDPYITRNGRSGQRQHGVDIYGNPEHLGGRVSGKLAGAQCKNTETLDQKTVDAEVTDAQQFQPPLSEFIMLTTARRDAVVQQYVRSKSWPFHVHILWWDDISLELSGHDDLLTKHFPGWMKKTTTRDDVVALILSSDPAEWTYNDDTGVYYLNRDVKLRIVLDRSEDADRTFHEPWVARFPDPEGRRQLASIHYGDTQILDLVCVWVDGARHLMPIPRSQNDLTMSHWRYHLGCILNAPIPGYGFAFALQRAGISVRGDVD